MSDRPSSAQFTSTPISFLQRAAHIPFVATGSPLRAIRTGVTTLLLALVVAVPPSSAQGPPVMVADLLPGTGSSNPSRFVDVDGLLYFTRNTALWRSDGTSGGTFLLQSTTRVTGNVLIPNLAGLDGVAIFSASGGSGYGLWRSDGTVAGTFQMTGVPLGTNPNLSWFTRAGDVVYFTDSATPSLWRTDGTAAGTVRIRTFAGADGSTPSSLTVVGSEVYFFTQATNGVVNLWRTDTAASSVVLLQAFANGYVPGPILYRDLAAVGNRFYFAQYTASAGLEVWKSDGTPESTALVRDLNPGSASSRPWAFTAIHGQLVFVASHPDDFDFYQVYRSDGTAAGTVLLAADFQASPLALSIMEVPGGFLIDGGTDAQGIGFFRFDITNGTATRVAGQFLWTGVTGQPVHAGDFIYYASRPALVGQDFELWRTDGTPAGTSQVADIWLGSWGSIPGNLTRVGGALFFSADDGLHGNELWRLGMPVVTPRPLATPDNYSTPAGTPLTVSAPGVLANDNANGGGAMTAQLVSTATSGTLSLNLNGSFTYTPPAGFSGPVTFVYRPVNGHGAGAAAVVTITVTPVIPPPTTVADAYTATSGTTLSIAAPGVLGNDSGAATALLVSTTQHGTLNLNANGAFTYTPAPGFSGTDQFTYRAVNAGGNGNVAAVTLTVNAVPVGPQPPTGLVAAAVSGSIVTLRWTPPAAGSTPTGYVMEGGVTPGTSLAVLPTGSTVPVFTFAAPTGAFYVRIRTVAGAQSSAPSNEIRLFVNNQSTPPGRRGGVLAAGRGGNLALTWQNTFDGGTPAQLVLDVSGSLAASLPLPPAAESFSFAGVPPGTYTFRVRALNAAGSSAPSEPVTMTFPASCTGRTPQTPRDYLAYRIGRTVHLLWNTAAAGGAPTSYVLSVTGTFNMSVPVGGRSLSAAVPPGTYTVRVIAVNECGASAPTAPTTLVVP